MFLALQLEREYTKQEILEFYLNQIYFGQGAYGVEAAAKTYFGKDVSALTLNECAMLAGIPKSPNYYSPFNNLEAARARRATVLEQMAKYHYISSSEASRLKKEDLKLARPQAGDTTEAAYFIDSRMTSSSKTVFRTRLSTAPVCTKRQLCSSDTML